MLESRLGRIITELQSYTRARSLRPLILFSRARQARSLRALEWTRACEIQVNVMICALTYYIYYNILLHVNEMYNFELEYKSKI